MTHQSETSITISQPTGRVISDAQSAALAEARELVLRAQALVQSVHAAFPVEVLTATVGGGHELNSQISAAANCVMASMSCSDLLGAINSAQNLTY